MKNWYNQKPDEVLKILGSSSEKGLELEETKNRIEKYGRNELEKAEKKSLLSKLAEQFKDPMIIILIVASILSAVTGSIEDTVIILAIVIVNAVLSIFQEGKAEAAVEALQKMSAPNAHVIRNGVIQEIDSTLLVPGDVVLLETGSIVPADLRILESSNLKIDESSLTGESLSVEKNSKITYDGQVEIGDRENMAYSSTIVTYGRGKGVVVETGKTTEIGKIAQSLSEYEDEMTPLQKRLAGLSKVLAILVVVVSVVVFLVGLFRGYEVLEIFMTAISLAVAAIPEGLAAIVTIVLSIGMGRMAENNSIVKKLLAVETLGTTTVICSDKTGTLTQNQMTITKVYVDGKIVEVTGTGYDTNGDFIYNDKKVSAKDISGMERLMGIATLSNDAELVEENGRYNIFGDPTEASMLTFAGKNNIKKEDYDKKYQRVEEIPFDSARKMMTTFNKNYFEGKIGSFTKGAPDIIIDRCDKIYIDGVEKEFTQELKDEALKTNKSFARQALRVLGYAYRIFEEIPAERTSENIENGMVFVGLTGMIDPPRPEVKDAIKQTKSAGITTIMITGDYLDTAFAIGKELGIASDESEAIMGRELNKMTEEEIREVVKRKRIFARVSPENKVQIVNALKQNGEIVAMTGDGVNDAPAIKKADIGIAMGITGTDVAKNTAEVILTDDNFATIVKAVKEGRIIYSNIRKFVSFLLSCNVGEVLIIFISILMGFPVPLTPKQLLWLNLVTDSFPALALGVEPGEEDIMKEAPRDPDEPILDKNMSTTLIIQSISITVATLAAYFIGMAWYAEIDFSNIYEGLSHLTFEELTDARTFAFATLITAELVRSFSVRSEKHTLSHIGFFTNKRLIEATSLSFVLMLIVIYVPVLSDLFDTFPLGVRDWAVIIGLSLVPLLIGEIYKKVKENK